MLNTEEVWKDIDGFPYEISTLGRVRRKEGTLYKQKNKEAVTNYKNNKGYWVVNLWVEGKLYHRQIHRLLAETFIPNPENLPYINHIDGDKTNNSLDNLEWCTHSHNMQHAWDTGLHKNYHSNASVKRKKCTSKYYGVYWSKERKKWCTTIGFNKKCYALGRYINEEDAAKAVDNFIKKNNLQQYGYKLNFS